jgi:pimeloyl-ACP methyl ester carboxylesterase
MFAQNLRRDAGSVLPGWDGLPEGWRALELPTFRATRGELAAYRGWLGAELGRTQGRATLAGLSMGAALAALAGAERSEGLERLIVFSPAGLPLDKPLSASMATVAGQVAHRCYPAGELCRMLAGTAAAPRAAWRLGRRIHERRAHYLRTLPSPRSSSKPTTANWTPETGHIWMITEPNRLAAEPAA